MMTKYFDSVKEWFSKNLDHEVVNECMICGKKRYVPEFLDKGTVMKIVTCDDCGFVWSAIQPTQACLDRFYKESESMQQWAEIKGTPEESIRQKEKFSHVWDFVKHHDFKSILDVGCGNGVFLNSVDSRVLRIGIEPNVYARDNCKYPTYKSLEDLKTSIHGPKKFELITMFGVLEHVKNPEEIVSEYYNRLEDGGMMAIIVPNISSLAVKILREDCSTFCPQHLHYFNIDTLDTLMDACGFSLDHCLTVEPEVQPILKKLRGLDPYMNIGFDLTDPDITKENILKSFGGYKIQAYFRRD